MQKRGNSLIRQAAAISAVVCLTTFVGLIVYWQAQQFLEEPISSATTPVQNGSGRPAQQILLESIPAPSSGKQVRSVASGAAGASDQLAQRLTQALQSAPVSERQTADQLVRFGLTGQMAELRNVDRADVEALAEHLTKQVPRTEIAEVLGQYLGVPRQTIMTADDPVESLMSLYDSVAGTAPVPDLGGPLVITDVCTTDARVIGRTQVLPEGVKRVYAVFENSGSLRGLDNVLVVWRMPADETMVYSKCEPLRSDAAYNYVWLQVDKGWPAGEYQVEFYDTRNNSVALAKRQFAIQ